MNSTLLYHNTSLLSAYQSSDPLSEESLLEARHKNKSIVNFTECENILRKNNLIEEDDHIIISQLDFAPNIQHSNNSIPGTSILYEFLNSRTNEIINTDICENSTMTVLIPLNTDLIDLNITEILELQSLANVNVFDKEDKFFNDFCLTFIDNSTEYDTTISSRREKFYQKYSIECKPKESSAKASEKYILGNNNCTFTGVDAYGFINCECGFSSNIEIETLFHEAILGDFLKWNIEITKCFGMFITNVSVII